VPGKPTQKPPEEALESLRHRKTEIRRRLGHQTDWGPLFVFQGPNFSFVDFEI